MVLQISRLQLSLLLLSVSLCLSLCLVLSLSLSLALFCVSCSCSGSGKGKPLLLLRGDPSFPRSTVSRFCRGVAMIRANDALPKRFLPKSRLRLPSNPVRRSSGEGHADKAHGVKPLPCSCASTVDRGMDCGPQLRFASVFFFFFFLSLSLSLSISGCLFLFSFSLSLSLTFACLSYESAQCWALNPQPDPKSWT